MTPELNRSPNFIAAYPTSQVRPGSNICTEQFALDSLVLPATSLSIRLVAYHHPRPIR